MKQTIKRVGMLLVVALLVAVAVGAAAADSGELKVNTDDNNRWDHPAIAMDGAGNFVVVWQENFGTYTGGLNIVARLYNASGVPQGEPFLVNTTTQGTQEAPAVAMDDLGNFVVVWESSADNADAVDIFGQRFDSSGAAVGGEFRVNSTTAGQQREPAVAMTDNAEFVVVYVSYAADSSGDVYAQRFDPSGNAAGAEFRVHEEPTNSQTAPDVAMADNGNFIVVWKDYNTTEAHPPLFFRRFDNTNTPLDTEPDRRGVSHPQDHGGASEPAIAADATGQFVIVWQSSPDDPPFGSTGIYAQRYAASGDETGSVFLVNTTVESWQTQPEVAMGEDGRFVISWTGQVNSQDTNIYAQAYHADGNPNGPEHRTNEHFESMQRAPAAAMDDAGRYVVAWTEEAYVSSFQRTPLGIAARVLEGPPLDNNTPVAAADTFTTQAGTALVISAPGVLSNDTDADGDLLQAVNRTSPFTGIDGSFTFNADGSFSYTPPTAFTGETSFEYIAGDDISDSGVAVVTLTVKDGNTQPSAEAGGPYSGGEGSGIALGGSGSSDADGDELTYSWSVDSPLCTFDNTTAVTPYLTCDDDGSFLVELVVSDGDTADSDTATVQVDNVAPRASFDNDGPVDEGGAFTLSLSAASDPGNADVAAGFTYAFDCDDGTGLSEPTTGSSITCTTGDSGVRTVTGIVQDKDGGQTPYSATVQVNNVAPEATFNATQRVDEGGDISLSLADVQDPSADDTAAGFTYAFDCGDGSGYASLSEISSATCPTTDDGTRAVRGKVRDKDGGTSEYEATVTVDNVAPTIHAIAGPAEPVALGAQPVEVTVEFSDPGTGDTHATAVDWGDGSSDSYADASPVAATHSYAEAGVYTLVVAVSDDDGAGDSDVYEYVVVFDENSSVSGHGAIEAAPEWCRSDAICGGASGVARFGFTARYKRGAGTPSGRTVFGFRTHDFEFVSDSYEQLIVNQAGTNGQFKGSGLINGELAKSGGAYKFMIWATDGTPDTFRIKIWYDENGVETVVYDNGQERAIDRGQIIVSNR